MNVLEVPREWVSRVAVVTRFDDDDTHRFFTDEEVAFADSFRFPHQKAEWFSARMAAKWLACSQGLATDPRSVRVEGEGRPSLKLGSGKKVALSLSHTDGLGGAAIDRESIGLDVQRVRPLGVRGWRFFLDDGEMTVAHSLSIDDVAIHCWCAKEAAWKALPDEYQSGGLKGVSLSLISEDPCGLSFRYASGTERGGVKTIRVGSLVVALAGC